MNFNVSPHPRRIRAVSTAYPHRNAASAPYPHSVVYFSFFFKRSLQRSLERSLQRSNEVRCNDNGRRVSFGRGDRDKETKTIH